MVSSTSAIAGEWALVSLALTLVAARLFVRLHINRDKIYIADAWLILAAGCALGLVICDTITYKAKAMHNFIDPGVAIWKVRYAENYLFDTGMYFPKFSIIAFYYTLVPPTQPQIRIALYVLTAITGASCLVTLCDAIFWCGTHVSSNWSADPDDCKAFSSMTMMRIHWSLNFTTEVLNVVFPYPLIRDLKLPRRREKIGLGVILSLGVITCAVSIGRFTNMVAIGNGFSIYLWTTAEQCVSIIVVALTALRPLLRKIAQIISSSAYSSDYNSGPSNFRSGSRTARSRAANVQAPATYWRNLTGTKRDDGNNDGNGSEVQLNELKGGQILKTEEIRISSEHCSQEGSRDYSISSGRPIGLDPAHIA